MGRRSKDRRVVSIYMDNELADELSQCKNASDIVNQILIDNCHRIGMLDKVDRVHLVEKTIKAHIKKELPRILREAVKELMEEME